MLRNCARADISRADPRFSSVDPLGWEHFNVEGSVSVGLGPSPSLTPKILALRLIAPTPLDCWSPASLHLF